MKYVVSLILILAMFATCTQDEDVVQDQLKSTSVLQVEMNPTDVEEVPATVQLKTFDHYVLKTIEVEPEPSTLTPELLEATLSAGMAIEEEKLAHVTPAPPKGDIMFVFDLTGSMYYRIGNAKANSVNIMNGLRALIPDTEFGVISHMDYNGSFSGCGYSASYGGGPDYPYSLDQALTPTIADAETAINGLSLGYGNDGPESYSRALWETVNDAGIEWRDGAKKIVVAWLDNIPHDCAYNAILGGATSSGPDPGRDEVVGTADDLAILSVLEEMKDNNVTLIALCGGGYNQTLWDAYASITGGKAVAVNYDGTIPGGQEIDEYISELIEEELSTVDNLTLEVCTEGFEDWMIDLDPIAYSPASLPGDFPFVVTYEVPLGTPNGVYEFDVCLMGDGVEYARQHVVITVLSAAFDVHPTSCPNPINRKGGGVIPMAILGTADFDVTMVDPATVMVNGISPLRWAMEDVATPHEPFTGKPLDRYACTTEGPDGYEDLTFKFDNREFATILAGYEVGDVVVLRITGEFLDGTAFWGEDVIWIVK